VFDLCWIPRLFLDDFLKNMAFLSEVHIFPEFTLFLKNGQSGLYTLFCCQQTWVTLSWVGGSGPGFACITRHLFFHGLFGIEFGVRRGTALKIDPKVADLCLCGRKILSPIVQLNPAGSAALTPTPNRFDFSFLKMIRRF